MHLPHHVGVAKGLATVKKIQSQMVSFIWKIKIRLCHFLCFLWMYLFFCSFTLFLEWEMTFYYPFHHPFQPDLGFQSSLQLFKLHININNKVFWRALVGTVSGCYLFSLLALLVTARCNHVFWNNEAHS